MATPSILTSPLFADIIFPFILIFVLIFAVLDRTKILGEGKRQINALISLAVALIFLGFSQAVSVVKNMVPFLAVAAVIILIFLALYGFIVADKEGVKLPDWLKLGGGIVVLVAVVIAVLIATGYWGTLWQKVISGDTITTTVIFVIVLGAAMAVVLSTGKSGN